MNAPAIIESPPVPEVYADLRRRAGLSPKSPEAARIGLSNSLYAVQIREEDRLIAMGRVVGDGSRGAGHVQTSQSRFRTW